ncbi:MAG: hypothetical protein WD490_04825 [Opitutales bacterium]
MQVGDPGRENSEYDCEWTPSFILNSTLKESLFPGRHVAPIQGGVMPPHSRERTGEAGGGRGSCPLPSGETAEPQRVASILSVNPMNARACFDALAR